MTTSRRDELADYSKEIRALQTRSQEALDRSLLTLSSAALGLSLAFASDVAGSDPKATCALIASWSLFALCILSTLVSFVTCQHCMDAMLEQAEAYYLKDDLDAFDVEPASLRVTRILNHVSLSTFGLGVVLTFVFVAVNL